MTLRFVLKCGDRSCSFSAHPCDVPTILNALVFEGWIVDKIFLVPVGE